MARRGCRGAGERLTRFDKENFYIITSQRLTVEFIPHISNVLARCVTVVSGRLRVTTMMKTPYKSNTRLRISLGTPSPSFEGSLCTSLSLLDKSIVRLQIFLSLAAFYPSPFGYRCIDVRIGSFLSAVFPSPDEAAIWMDGASPLDFLPLGTQRGMPPHGEPTFHRPLIVSIRDFSDVIAPSAC